MLHSRAGSDPECTWDQDQDHRLKLTLPVSGSKMRVAIWASSTPEHFLIHMHDTVHIIKQMGLDTREELRYFFVCYLLKSTKSDVVQLSAKLDSFPISFHQQWARSKKNPAIEGPPLCIQKCASRIKPMQILQMLHHGDDLKIWRDIGRFLYHRGILRNPHKTHTRQS